MCCLSNVVLVFLVHKYCPMLERDGIVKALEEIKNTDTIDVRIKDLAEAAIDIHVEHKGYRPPQWAFDYDSDAELERQIRRLQENDENDDSNDDDEDFSGSDSEYDFGGLYFDVLEFAMDASSDDSISDSDEDSSDDDNPHMLPYGNISS